MITYYEVGLNNLKALASRFGYYYDPDCLGLSEIVKKEKRDIDCYTFYNNELSRIEEIESLMHKN